jgi:hypothetical protein
MKKTYEKPRLTRKGKLSTVTSGTASNPPLNSPVG